MNRYKTIIMELSNGYTCPNTGVVIEYDLSDLKTYVRFRNLTWIAKGVLLCREDTIVDVVTQWLEFISYEELTDKDKKDIWHNIRAIDCADTTDRSKGYGIKF